MKQKDRSEIIESLRDDKNYYGEVGQQFLSNSNIKKLLEDPMSFGKPVEKTVAMMAGSYFHLKMLEPEKVQEFKDRMIVNASTRSTKLYKEALIALDTDILMLEKEADDIDVLCKKMKSNLDFHSEIYEVGNVYEEPGLVELHGNMWKCKADILSSVSVPDIKTTGDISKFVRSAYMYNYDSAAYIYQKAFGVPMVFLVGCKKTHQLARFTCSSEFIASGESKVLKATMVYDKYFGENPTHDIQEYYIQREL